MLLGNYKELWMKVIFQIKSISQKNMTFVNKSLIRGVFDSGSAKQE